ncbi:hypothetical protein AVEN_183826-1 [Araneus ventricosus]|uniref:RNase H type-1 domain-containing protein n=1 Tax=Araneus ventricosus TaxID=182803 RepID=A0A4Y2N6D5_ARAVE|nr:hypothetical protein AVEN_183826-1 [Araneus ventricosus]
MHIKSLITICCLYLPPHQTVHQTELKNLISQLPSLFLILGDLNGHSPLWGGTETNSRGRQIEQLLDHNICLLNNNEKTHFHLPTHTFHSIDLALCTPALLPFLNLTVDDNFHNSDHFPPIITDNRHNSASHYYSPKYVYNAADWQKFSSLADITSAIIDNHTVDEALENIISIIKTAADASIPLAKGTRRQYKPWWNDLCQQAYKAKQKAWNIFRRYPTTANLIKFKKSKADSRRIQRQSQADRLSLQRIYRSTILSKLDYGSAIYGSARKSVLKKLDPIHHSALRLCSGAFRTSPTSSLYVDCYEHPLEIRRQMLSLHYYLRISSNTRYPCHGFQLRPFLHRLKQARTSSVPTFFERMHNLMKDFNLHEVPISLQQSFLPPWKDYEFKYLNPFGSFDKFNTSDTIFQQLFADRLRFHDFVPIYTDGSKLSSRISFAVVFPKSVSAFTLLPFCSIFTAEITAVFHALKQILKCPIGKYAIYTDSLSVLQALNSLHCKSHPLVFSVLDL